MKTEDTIREHFKLLRSASHPALADYHCNLLYGYLQALRDTSQLDTQQYRRLHHALTKAWSLKLRINMRRAA